MQSQIDNRKLPIGVSEELSRLHPTGEDDFTRLAAEIIRLREAWRRELLSGCDAIRQAAQAAGYEPTAGEERVLVLRGRLSLGGCQVALQARLKKTEAILGKMKRYGEGLAEILDIWGYRLVVPDGHALDDLATSLTSLWDPPTEADLKLRRGDLQFSPWRDYRRQDHLGLAESTASTYDEAVHLNRRAPFGLVEIQILTQDLYNRAFVSHENEESHVAFRRRRTRRRSRVKGTAG